MHLEDRKDRKRSKKLEMKYSIIIIILKIVMEHKIALRSRFLKTIKLFSVIFLALETYKIVHKFQTSTSENRLQTLFKSF